MNLQNSFELARCFPLQELFARVVEQVVVNVPPLWEGAVSGEEVCFHGVGNGADVVLVGALVGVVV